ncbi:MAG: hypothetical protein JWO43_616 [Candidatus Adlerbacteria bacterium]|nr:hypothetical protein [Candidatus Adlerbacteria bacterium]
MLFKKIVTFFDKLEDKVRFHLSRWPIVYALIGGVGIVLFWKGVWETAEYSPYLHGPASIVLGTVIMLMTGLLVSFFIGDSIIMSGFKREKKLVEKTEEEIRAEGSKVDEVMIKLDQIERELETIEADHAHDHQSVK